MAEKWPFGNEDATTRARRAAKTYQQALNLNNPVLCRRIDRMLADLGESWVLNREVTVESDGLDELTTAQAAELANVPPHTIRRWATLNHPDRPADPLLPRFGKRGRETTHLAKDVVAAAERMRGPVGLPPINR